MELHVRIRIPQNKLQSPRASDLATLRPKSAADSKDDIIIIATYVYRVDQASVCRIGKLMSVCSSMTAEAYQCSMFQVQ